MKPLHHALISATIASSCYLATKSIPLTAATFVAGTLIDVDHLVDVRHKIFDLTSYVKLKKMHIWLHSWELWFVLLILSLVIPNLFWISIAYFAHLVADCLAYRKSLRWFSLIWRIRHNFTQDATSQYSALSGTKIALALYLWAYVTTLSSYTMIAKSNDFVQLLAALQWFLPMIMLLFMGPKVHHIFSKTFWRDAALVVTTVCFALSIWGVPGLWWSWSTAGLIALIFAFVIDSTDSVILALSAVLLGFGSWEILYQTGLYFYHEFFGSGLTNYLVVVAENMMWIIPALIVVVVIRSRQQAFQPQYVLIALCALFSVACTTLWFSNGMDVPLLWWQGQGPFLSDASPQMIAVSRGSQGFWCVAIAMIFGRRVQSASVVKTQEHYT